MCNTLGEGCCGKVRLVFYLGKWAAMKIVPYNIMSEADIRRECRVYETLDHKNVVKLLGPPVGACDGWHIPLQFINGSTLEELIFPPDKLSTSEKDHLIFGMCDGLRYLHSRNVVHQDLKPNNIMVRHSTKEAVIIDLGLAKFVNYTESGNPVSSGQNRGFRQYAAPEAHDGYIRTRASDVWSMGKVISEVILGYRLDWDQCSPKNVNNLLNGSKYASIVCRMLKENQNIRVTMEDVVNDLRSVNTPLTRAEGSALNGPVLTGTDSQREYRYRDPRQALVRFLPQGRFRSASEVHHYRLMVNVVLSCGHCHRVAASWFVCDRCFQNLFCVQMGHR